jgi:hypothetical protein
MTLTRRGTFLNEEVRRADLSNDDVQRHGSVTLQFASGDQIDVTVEYVGDDVIASDEQSGIFCEGHHIAQAVVDLVTHMDLALKDLEEYEGPLSPEFADELKRLRYYLRG